jgi:hypothetical protein
MLHDAQMRRVYVRGVLVGAIDNDDYESIKNRVLSDKSIIARQFCNYLTALFFVSFDYLIYTSAIWGWTVGFIAIETNRNEITSLMDVVSILRTSFAWSLLLGIVLMIGRVSFVGVKGYKNIFEFEISEDVKRSIGCASSDHVTVTY